MKEKSAGLGIAMVYIGTLIGAGFASGQELYQFFARFGTLGLIGVCIAGILFAVVGYIVLSIARKNKDIDSEKIILPFRSKPIEIILSILLGHFLFGIIVVMLAGAGALLQETYELSPWIGSTLMMALVFLTVLSGKSGIIKSFKLAVPFLIFGMLAVIIFALMNSDWSNINSQPVDAGGSWIISTILFVSYNMILATSVLVPLGKELNTKSTALKGALMGGFTLGAIGLLVVLVIILNSSQLKGVEVPIVHLASRLSGRIGRSYSIILLVGIYTTAVGCIFALQEKLVDKIRFDIRILSLIILSVALFMSNIGFSNLISVVYPISGYIGLFMLAGVIRHIFKRKRQ